MTSYFLTSVNKKKRHIQMYLSVIHLTSSNDILFLTSVNTFFRKMTSSNVFECNTFEYVIFFLKSVDHSYFLNFTIFTSLMEMFENSQSPSKVENWMYGSGMRKLHSYI